MLTDADITTVATDLLAECLQTPEEDWASMPVTYSEQ